MQDAALPSKLFAVQAFESSQLVGQLATGSQYSPLSTTPFPQTGLQSSSFVELQPEAQHPSPSVQVVMGS